MVEPTVAQPVKKKSGVAEAVVFFTSKKAKNLKEKLKNKNKEAESLENIVKEKKRKLRILRHTTSSLEEKYESMTQKKRRELVDEYRQVITLLKQEPFIAGFRVDKKKRVIVLTKPIKIKCDNWPRKRNAGQFEIRIDFGKDGYRNGVEILNVTRRYKDYDSPTIIKTNPCWGNVGGDIEREFDSQDLHELIVDLVDYISSTNTKAGYLGDNDGDKEGGWKVFLDGAKRLEKEYSFEKYDQQVRGKKVKNISQTLEGYNVSESIQTGFEISSAQLERYVDAIALTSSTTITWNQTASAPTFRMSRDEYELNSALRELGFTERASYYFVGLILEDINNLESGGRHRIDRFELSADRTSAPVNFREVDDQLESTVVVETRFNIERPRLTIEIVSQSRSEGGRDASDILLYHCRKIDFGKETQERLLIRGAIQATGANGRRRNTMENIF